ncbi:MAG: hypothetical protein FJ224_10150 [Lentisphaerae bacterium]|nr:hypothetical protein [Lentisphaerota bacterium]
MPDSSHSGSGPPPAGAKSQHSHFRFPPEYQERSRAVLERSLRELPAYRGWRAHDPGPAHDVSERYRVLPTIAKSDIRAHFPHGFVPGELDLDGGLKSGEVSLVHTSGTTEDRVTLLWHQGWWDESERRSWQLNGHAARVATGAHREVVVASPRCVGPPREPGKRLSRRMRTLGRLLFVNEHPDVAAWDDDELRRMADEINEYRPAVVEGDPPYLAALSFGLNRLGIAVHRPEIVVLTYSFPSRAHMRWIRRMFDSPVCSSHGSTEAGYVFIQCEAGRFHQNTACCRVDFRPWQERFGGPMLGSIVVTPFGNPWFQILRFDLGDLIRLPETQSCPCGRSRGIIAESMEGRGRDVTLSVAGRPLTVGAVDAEIGALSGVLTYCVEQTAASAFALRIVPDGSASAGELERAATAAMKRLYGRLAEVRVVTVAAIRPEPSGKYRLARPMIRIDPEVFSA